MPPLAAARANTKSDGCEQPTNSLLEILLIAGLPPGTRIAHKNGWIPGVRHGAGVVFPDDAAPYTIVVCTSTSLAVNEHNDAACQLVARIAAASWADRTWLAKW